MNDLIETLLLLGMVLLVFQWVREDVIKMKTGSPGLLDLARTALASLEIGFLFAGILVLVTRLWMLFG
jgi:hypothetical protein